MTEPITRTVDVEVRYVETDQMGVVHHANYIIWFELARTHLCQELDLHYADIEERGYLLMVTGIEAKYRKGARYGEIVQVTARIARLWSRGVRYAYEVRRDDTLLATGASEHVWIDHATGKPIRLPPDLQEGMARVAGVTGRKDTIKGRKKNQ
ncbi:MAG: thioesterase family protein [Acidobacteria bacterium]|nr:thioesterase family protein [Acidobacteriota bacterium]MCZ6726902.1 thioesterase family protein [Acidobacteriota bacterium]